MGAKVGRRFAYSLLRLNIEGRVAVSFGLAELRVVNPARGQTHARKGKIYERDFRLRGAKPLTGLHRWGIHGCNSSSGSSAWPASRICSTAGPCSSTHRCQVPLGARAIQVAFTLFVLIETWLVPVEGYLVDRFGPQWVVIGGGSWSGLRGHQFGREFAAGAVSRAPRSAASAPARSTAPASATRSSGFPGRRGIAAGITASGFGAGAALTIVPISHMIASAGYQHAFLFFGLLQGGIVFVLAWLLLVPPPQIVGARRSSPSRPRTATRRARCCGARCSM